VNFFSKNLRYLREKNDLTQDDMKPLLGIGNTTWSNYENGVCEPRIEVLISISKYFGVTLDELIAVDITAQYGSIVRNPRHKPYATNNAAARVEEPRTDLCYIVKELKKLRKDVDAMRQTTRK
jgi:transcriptional regulator with XRE-family HTH domain